MNTDKITLTWAEARTLFDRMVEQMRKDFPGRDYLRAYGIPRGGWNVVGLGDYLSPSDTIHDADVLVDDIIDSGETEASYGYTNKPFYALIDKTQADSFYRDKWVVFPWERGTEEEPEENVRRILSFIGEDPKRSGLIDTPKRFLKAMKEHTSGYSIDPADILGVSFDLSDAHEGAVYDQIILSGPLPFSSLCEHHLAPFEGVAWIGYLPGSEGRVVGLSKLARVLEVFAKRLQVQERMTVQIADAVEKYLNPLGVGVMVRSRHLCQCHRGVKKEGRMITSILRGNFRNCSVKAEFMELVKLSQ